MGQHTYHGFIQNCLKPQVMRWLFIFICLLVLCYFILQSTIHFRNEKVPVFLRRDTIAENHQTIIDFHVHSLFKPDSAQLSVLLKDYSGIWAHLNYLYHTNDVEAGEEYYTEDWFRYINHQYNEITNGFVERKDLRHSLHIKNFAWDGLVCAAIDSNVVIRYSFQDKKAHFDTLHFGIALVFQGDHWRLDALKILNP